MKLSVNWSVRLVAGACVAALASGCQQRTADEIAAEATFRESGRQSAIRVYPAFIRDGKQGRHDDAAAQALAAALRADGFEGARACDEHAPLAATPHFNQAALYRENREGFRAYLAQHPTDEPYALLPEVLVDGRDRPIGIHAYLLDRAGVQAGGTLLNSHHDVFHEHDPQTVDAAIAVLIAALREEWKREEVAP